MQQAPACWKIAPGRGPPVSADSNFRFGPAFRRGAPPLHVHPLPHMNIRQVSHGCCTFSTGAALAASSASLSSLKHLVPLGTTHVAAPGLLLHRRFRIAVLHFEHMLLLARLHVAAFGLLLSGHCYLCNGFARASAAVSSSLSSMLTIPTIGTVPGSRLRQGSSFWDTVVACIRRSTLSGADGAMGTDVGKEKNSTLLLAGTFPGACLWLPGWCPWISPRSRPTTLSCQPF